MPSMLLYLLLAVLLGSLGRAEDEPSAAPWYMGRFVAQVSLEAPEGGLPEENLEPLLRTVQGSSLDPQVVRQDLEMLYRVGSFSAVEAHVEPWVWFDESGEVIDALRVVYRVFPPSRVQEIEVTGGRARSQALRIAEQAVPISRGEAFFPDQDAETVADTVRSALVSEGWSAADVQVRSSDLGEGQLAVEIVVDPGPVEVYGPISLGGDLVLSVPWYRVWQRWHDPSSILRRHGVRQGERIVQDRLQAARTEIMDELVSHGWLNARVNFLFFDKDQAGQPLSVLITAGPKLEISATEDARGINHNSPLGLTPGLQKINPELFDLLGLTPGVRVTPAVVDEARERVVAYYQERGFYSVDVQTELTPTEAGQHLDVSIVSGGRRTVRVPAVGWVFPNARRVYVSGADTLGDIEVKKAILAASPEILGQGWFTQEAMQDALKEVVEVYRGQGFLDAKVVLDSGHGAPEEPGVVVRPERKVGRIDIRVYMEIHVKVDEGPRTTLALLEADGGLGIEDELIEAARDEYVGQPYRPAYLDRLARKVVEAYRSEGYLDADALVDASLAADKSTASVRLQVVPGSRYRLRSVIVQGNRRTRRSVIDDQLEVVLGEPITPEAIDKTRSNLYDLDLFTVVSPELVGDDDRAKDLFINLEERRNILFETGGGLSTDQGLTLTAKAAHRNLGGLGHRVSTIGQVGYPWFADGWTIDPEQPVWLAAVRYEAPNVPFHSQRLIVEGLLNEVVQEQSYRLVRSGGSVGVKLDPDQHTEAIVEYSFQARKLEDVDPGMLVLGDPWLETLDIDYSHTDELVLPSARRLQGGLGLALVWDHRDSRLNPSSGHLVTGEVKLYDGLVSGPLMLRGVARGERLWGVGPLIFDVVANGGLGWVEGRATTLPLEDRFYLGGSSSLRGFSTGSVGPANESPRPEIDFPTQVTPITDHKPAPAHWVPTGGDSMASLSLELRVPFPVLGLQSWDTTSVFIFSDTGRVAFVDQTILVDSRDRGLDPAVRTSVGAGLRMATPIGPAAVSLGVNPFPLDERDERWVTPHLTLGTL